MAKVKKTVIGLKCTETGKVNYTLYKPNNKGGNKEKLTRMKYNRDLKKHTKHVEVKL